MVGNGRSFEWEPITNRAFPLSLDQVAGSSAPEALEDGLRKTHICSSFSGQICCWKNDPNKWFKSWCINFPGSSGTSWGSSLNSHFMGKLLGSVVILIQLMFFTGFNHQEISWWGYRSPRQCLATDVFAGGGIFPTRARREEGRGTENGICFVCWIYLGYVFAVQRCIYRDNMIYDICGMMRRYCR